MADVMEVDDAVPSTTDSTTELSSTEELVLQYPDLKIAQLKFLLTAKDYDAAKKEAVGKEFLEAIKANNMAQFYEESIEEIGWKKDETMLEKMRAENEQELKRLESAIEDAVANLGESEVREAWQRKAEFLCKIGDKAGCLSAFRQTADKTIGTGHQLDIAFQLIRVGFFYMDHSVINANVSKAKYLMEQGGDWDRKNRLKAYEGLYALAVRDFKSAAGLLLDCVSTFTSYELMSYEKLVFYAVVAGVLSLERKEIQSKLIKQSEVQEQLHGQPRVKGYLMGLYDCEYDKFFEHLAWVEQELKFDYMLHPHYTYYTKSMRALAYQQFIGSYRSLTLDYMAERFGVSSAFIDTELHKLIASGNLHCKMDKINRVVEMNQLDQKNVQYQELIKHGDILLNRIQKLSRVINA